MIRILDHGNLFLKSKTNMDKDLKEQFRMEIVKKTWFSQRLNMPWVLKFTYR